MEKRNFFNKLFTRSTKPTQNCVSLSSGSVYDVSANDIVQFISKVVVDSAEVKTIINRIAETFATIPMYHVRIDAEDNITYLSGGDSWGIDYCLNVEPNEMQDPVKFWVTVISHLLNHNIVAIYPEWDSRMERLKQLIPLPEILGDPMEFDGKFYYDIPSLKKRVPVRKLIILSRFSSYKGTYGGREITLQKRIAQEIQKQALNGAISPTYIQAFLQLKGVGTLSPEAAQKRAEEVAKQISSGMISSNGFKLPFVQGDVDLKTINLSNIPVNDKLLEMAINTICEWFNVPKSWLSYNINEFQNELIINGAFMPLAKQIEGEFTRKLFSEGERNHGNRIQLDLVSLQASTLSSKISLLRQGIQYGGITPDEWREMMRLGKRKDGLGQEFYQTLNVVKSTDASEYQMQMATNGNVDNRIKVDIESENE